MGDVWGLDRGPFTPKRFGDDFVCGDCKQDNGAFIMAVFDSTGVQTTSKEFVGCPAGGDGPDNLTEQQYTNAMDLSDLGPSFTYSNRLHAVECAPTNALTDAPTDAPTDVPTDAPTDAPANAPTDAPTDVPTDALTNAPTKLGSCKYHSQCNAGEKCKGFWNMDKMCRKRKTNCKLRGTKRNKKWGCSAGKKCDPNPNEKSSKWGTCANV